MVEFGRNENQLYHTFRHVERAGLPRDAVERAIGDEIARLDAEMLPGFSAGLVVVASVRLRYSACRLPDGSVHVGRITVEGSGDKPPVAT